MAGCKPCGQARVSVKIMVASSKVEVWLMDLSGSRGHEQKSERPGIIWKDLDHVRMAIVMPCTTRLERTTIPYTHLLSPTLKNGLSQNSVALLFQITSIDKTRLVKKLGELDDEDVKDIHDILKDMLRL